MDTDMDMDMDVSTRLLRATAALSALTTAEDPPSADAIPTTTTTTTTIDTVPIQASLAALREAELQQKSTSKFGLDDGDVIAEL
ncbi:hypothetical protein N0V88_003462 [Collariella sp. IMI 366227]|nr:hypothetical protein N0V88_003462 [Collariella sp. IMI 366227]